MKWQFCSSWKHGGAFFSGGNVVQAYKVKIVLLFLMKHKTNKERTETPPPLSWTAIQAIAAKILYLNSSTKQCTYI